MYLLLFCLLGVSHNSIASNEIGVIERDCQNCTANGTAVFLKIKFSPSSKPLYACKESTFLISRFGLIVDHSCKPSQCERIDSRPITRTSTFMDFECESPNGKTTNFHQQILSIVKDYLEICFMSVVLALLVIKKALYTKCFEKNINEMLGINNVKLDKVDSVNNTDESVKYLTV